MKKISSLIINIIILLFATISVSAAGESVSLKGSSANVQAGGTVSYTLSVSGSSAAKSAAVSVTYSDNFELVSGEWLKSGALMTNFDTNTNKGVLSYGSATDMNGSVFKVTLRAKSASSSAQAISVNLQLKDGSTVICNQTASTTTKVTCVSHTYGSWINNNTTNHMHTCDACGNMETQNHTWNTGTIIKTANCKESGTKTFTCTTCNATKTETIEKTTNHSFSVWNTTKMATCTNAGSQSRTCSICGKTEIATINATGHSYGTWTQSKEATCTSTGMEKRSCTKSGCSHSEARSTVALGHSFSNPTVIKQPTCTEAGTEKGKCKRCNQETSNTIKAVGHSYSEWNEVTAATCIEKGKMERTCIDCSEKQTKDTEALGHDFENPVIVKEATISSTGLMEGKCKNCGVATQQIIPCKVEDVTTGIVVETNESIFPEGTIQSFEEITETDANYESVKNAVADKGGTFTAYNIDFKKDGVVVAPNGEYTLMIPNKTNIKSENLVVVYVSIDGVATEKEFALNEDGLITINTTDAGTYVVIDISTRKTDENVDVEVNSEKPKDKKWKDETVGIVIAIGLVVVIMGAVIILVLYKRKKDKNVL